jgi:hypothetical protein
MKRKCRVDRMTRSLIPETLQLHIRHAPETAALRGHDDKFEALSNCLNILAWLPSPEASDIPGAERRKRPSSDMRITISG